jgi:hypothetical protein
MALDEAGEEEHHQFRTAATTHAAAKPITPLPSG